MGLEAALWRAVAVYRWLALAYATLLVALNTGGYAHPAGAWAVLGVMTVWTLYATLAYGDPGRRGPVLLGADLTVATGCVLATAFVESAEGLAAGRPTLPVSWVASAVLAWAVYAGRRAGLLAAGVLGVGNLAVFWLGGGGPSAATFNGIVLLAFAGLVVGHVVRLARDAEARLARAVELESATRERERLARSIHDSVLQVLAMVRRRGDGLGGEAAEIGRLAGEQEAALRSLVGARAAPGSASVERGRRVDLRVPLTARGSAEVVVSTPATPVPVPERVAAELDAASAAALDNVVRHCPPGTRVWVLLEDERPEGGGAGAVTVSVRDDGPGMEPGRLARAAADGRLGVAQSILGRVRDLGGSVRIESAPGRGTEIEMTVRVEA